MKQHRSARIVRRQVRLIAAGTVAVAAIAGMQPTAVAEPKAHGGKLDAQAPTQNFDIPARTALKRA